VWAGWSSATWQVPAGTWSPVGTPPSGPNVPHHSSPFSSLTLTSIGWCLHSLLSAPDKPPLPPFRFPARWVECRCFPSHWSPAAHQPLPTSTETCIILSWVVSSPYATPPGATELNHQRLSLVPATATSSSELAIHYLFSVRCWPCMVEWNTSAKCTCVFLLVCLYLL
jgi:hypothetical protein